MDIPMVTPSRCRLCEVKDAKIAGLRRDLPDRELLYRIGVAAATAVNRGQRTYEAIGEEVLLELQKEGLAALPAAATEPIEQEYVLDRYVYGKLMAEGAKVKATSLAEAKQIALARFDSEDGTTFELRNVAAPMAGAMGLCALCGEGWLKSYGSPLCPGKPEPKPQVKVQAAHRRGNQHDEPHYRMSQKAAPDRELLYRIGVAAATAVNRGQRTYEAIGEEVLREFALAPRRVSHEEFEKAWVAFYHCVGTQRESLRAALESLGLEVEG